MGITILLKGMGQIMMFNSLGEEVMGEQHHHDIKQGNYAEGILKPGSWEMSHFSSSPSSMGSSVIPSGAHLVVFSFV